MYSVYHIIWVRAQLLSVQLFLLVNGFNNPREIQGFVIFSQLFSFYGIRRKVSVEDSCVFLFCFFSINESLDIFASSFTKHRSVSRTAILNSFLRFVLVSLRTKPLLSFSGLLRPSETIKIIDVGLSHQVQSFYHRFLEKHHKKRVVGKFKKLLLTLNIFLLITVWSPVKEMDSFSNSLLYQSLSRRLRMFAERVTYLRLTLHFEHHTWQHGLMPKTMLKMFHHAQFND